MASDIIQSFIVVLVSAYLQRDESPETFEKTIRKCLKNEERTEKEAEIIIKHFRKEVFPLDKKILIWMKSNLSGKSRSKFVTKYKEFQKICIKA